MAGIGVALLWKYALTPGDELGALAQWPARSTLRLRTDIPTLVLFVHPRCPCSRTTIRELAAVLAKSPPAIEAQVVVYKPIDSGAEWEQTDLWRAAERIPGVTMVVDLDGVEAKRFSVTTSGHALLYDPQGRRLFSGGITAARGHQGQCEGQDAIVSLLSNGKQEVLNTPVYGCQL
jgi:hypothetical protein